MGKGVKYYSETNFKMFGLPKMLKEKLIDKVCLFQLTFMCHLGLKLIPIGHWSVLFSANSIG